MTHDSHQLLRQYSPKRNINPEGVLTQSNLHSFDDKGSPRIKPHYVEIDVNDPEQLKQVAADMKAKKFATKRDSSVTKLQAELAN